MERLEEREVVKFVLNDRSFDTATSEQVAVSRGVEERNQMTGQFSADRYYDAEQVRFERVLFRTAKGNFFLHDHTTLKFPKGKPVVEDEATELSPEEALRWVMDTGAAVLDSTGLPMPDEA